MKTIDQVNQLKLNVTNINSFLIKSNKEYSKLRSENKNLIRRQSDRKEKQEKEKKLEIRTSPVGKITENVQDTITSGGSILDKILNFGGLLLAGILVNNLPGIITKVKEIIDNIVNFLTPIQSGFNLIKAFFTGELDEKELDADKKRVDDALEDINGKGGLIDQLAEKAGPLGGLIKTLKPAIELVRGVVGGKKMVLAKKGGKEGVLNKETGEFTERQFTSAERQTYEGRSTGSTGSTGSTETNQNVTTLGSGNTQLKNFTDQDFSDLAFIVSHEALRGTDDEYGVAAAVLNRVTDPRFPNTIMGVGTATGQFEAVFSGKAYRDENLAKKLKNNQGKIVEALKKLNGRTDFKAVSSMGKYKGDTDIMFADNGNFYHYAEQVGKYDPIPSNIPQHWKKLIGNYVQSNTGSGRDGKFGAGTFGKGRPSDSDRLSTLSQPDPRENSSTIIAVQRVNTIQTAYVPVPVLT
jgi:regulator of replication initiation timing